MIEWNNVIQPLYNFKNQLLSDQDFETKTNECTPIKQIRAQVWESLTPVSFPLSHDDQISEEYVSEPSPDEWSSSDYEYVPKIKIKVDEALKPKKHANSVLKKEISFVNQREKSDPDYLSSRCDVVYKSILRNFRRFYQTMFKQNTEHSRKTKNEHLENNLRDFSRILRTLHFDESFSEEDLMFYIGSLICPLDIIKKKIKLPQMKEKYFTGRHKKEWVDKILMVHDALYKFSIQKVTDLMKNSYLAQLFKLYYETIQGTGSYDLSKAESKSCNRRLSINTSESSNDLEEIYKVAFEKLVNIKVEN